MAEIQGAATGVFATSLRSGWVLASMVAIYSLAVGGMFYGTIQSMVRTWIVAETFTHGFLILPISLWLVWRQRRHLAACIANPQPAILFLTIGASLVWVVAHLADVKVIQQLAFVCILITGIWSIVGTTFATRIAFPLGFLLLAVPMGEQFIPPLMEFTADTIEFLVRGSGVPVYREGTYLSLPSGNWSVVEACSGVRYLIASFTLGLLYAYLSYNSYWRRAAFVLASILVPIIANSIRAYGIVMIGHLSNMEYATGVDHLLYGWVFFGIAMILLFWVGGFWHEAQPESTRHRLQARNTVNAAAVTPTAYVLVTLFAIAASGAGPALARAVENKDIAVEVGALVAPVAQPGWQVIEDPAWNWQPKQIRADRELDAYFTSAGHPVGLILRQYLRQRPGVELVQGRQTWRADRKAWRVVDERRVSIELVSTVEVDEAILVSAQTRLLVWSWYFVGRTHTANLYLAKLLEIKQKMLEGHREGARLFIVTPVGENRPAARKVLQQFLEKHHAGIIQALDTPGSKIGMQE